MRGKLVWRGKRYKGVGTKGFLLKELKEDGERGAGEIVTTDGIRLGGSLSVKGLKATGGQWKGLIREDVNRYEFQKKITQAS